MLSTVRITNNLSRRINTAVILAAGARARMNPYTVDKLKQDRLKPVIDIAGKPLLHWTLEKKWLHPRVSRKALLKLLCEVIKIDRIAK